MRLSIKPFCSVSLALTLTLSVLAQDAKQVKPVAEKTVSTEKAETGPPEKVLTVQQQHALGLLDQLFETSRSFDDDTVKIQIQGRIADVLWEHDEARARQAFEDAFHAIDSLTVKQDPNKDKNQLPFVFASKQYQLRSEILRMVTKRDSRLAEKLTKSVVDVPMKDNPALQLMGMGSQSEQSELYLELAQSIAETDPTRAAEMAKESLRTGFSPSLVSLMLVIRKKNATIADEIFTEALASLKSKGSQASSNISVLLSYVFPNSPGSGSISFGDSPGSAAPVDSTNPVLIAQFLNFAYDSISQQINSAATATDNNGQMADMRAVVDYSMIQRLMPYFDQYMPDKSATIKTRLDEVSKSMSTTMKDRMNAIPQNATVSDLLTKAEGAKTPQEKDQFYISAALKASQSDDPEQAISIIQKVSNPQMQGSLGTVIRMQVATRAMAKDDFDLAYRVAKDIPNLSQRSTVFGMLANKLVDKKDMVRAREFLSDAETSVLKALDGTDKANALLQITSIMVRVDTIRAFDTMRSAVDAVNHSTFTDPNAGNPTNNGGMTFVTFGTNTFNFDGALTPLSRSDFQKSLLLAQAIEMKEASTLAQISVCRGVLVKSAEQNASEKADKEEKDKKDETVKT